MKTLHFYLTRQMLAALGMTALVFTFVLVLANGIKKVLLLLVSHQVSLGVAFKALVLLIPYVLAFSLPVGMLTAALLVFGRFSADQELTAARAGGVSLLSLAAPVLLLSVAVSAVCAWLNFDVAPASRMAYKALLFQAGSEHPTAVLENGEPMMIGPYSISAGKVGSDGSSLENVTVTVDDTNGLLESWHYAPTGRITVDTSNQAITLSLSNSIGDRRSGEHWEPVGMGQGVDTFPDIKYNRNELDMPLSDMTLLQLLHRKAQVERDLAAEPLRGKTTAELRQAQREFRENVTGRTLTPVLVNLQREAAFSFASIAFTLIGIPLGVRGHRRETSIGVAIALVLMLIYYSFIVLAQAWASHPERGPQYIVWLPNFVFQAAGAVLLWRANRGR